ncbi:hypothetical protein IAU60_001433 [Kwoniella sp. DSM 27419]
MAADTLGQLRAAAPRERLVTLKELKNSVIGNTWKKVEVANDERLLMFFLSLLKLPQGADQADLDTSLELMGETAVIIGALANVGNLTLRPLLSTSTTPALMSLITNLTGPSGTHTISARQLDRLLPSLLRALRNVLIATADMIWGHMWGVGAERKVVGTGLVGSDAAAEKDAGKGKEVAERRGDAAWRREAHVALSIVFEPTNLATLLGLLDTSTDPQTILPLYQLFARLVALPSHRETLTQWSPHSSHQALYNDPGPSAVPMTGQTAADAPEPPFIISHLLSTVLNSGPSAPGRKPNVKLIEAALELLAALIKGQPGLASAVRSWSTWEIDEMQVDDAGEEAELPTREGLLSHLIDLVTLGPASVRTAAASCLTNILKADKGLRTLDRVRSTVINLQLLEEVTKLLSTDNPEERVRLCFILAALVSDDATLQKSADDRGCTERVMVMLLTINQDQEDGEVNDDLASRSREAALLALASLAMQHEPTRMRIADHDPPILPIVLSALSSPSYGVRAAACQLGRAMSRNISILRTTLVDSGVGEEIIKLLQREVAARDASPDSSDCLGDRVWTVEVIATATIANIVADFSPLRTRVLRDNGLELLCELTNSPFEPLAVNALWALKNLCFHALESIKAQVVTVLGWDRLTVLLSSQTPQSLRVEAFSILQNLLADATPSEITRTVDGLGDKQLLDLLAESARDKEDVELRVPALHALANLALGNERIRSAIISRVELLEVLSDGLNSKADVIKVPSIKAMRHLIESNARTHRPRQGMIEHFQPYQLKTRLRDLAEGSVSLDVCQAAVGLLDVLERERGSGVSTSGR